MAQENKTELADIVKREIERIVELNKKLEEAQGAKYSKTYKNKPTYRT